MQTHSETALGSALNRAGVRREDVEFDKAIAKYLNAGGTIERAYGRLDLVAAKVGKGPPAHAGNGLGRNTIPDSQLPAGRAHYDGESDLLVPDRQPQANVRDHSPDADSPQASVPPVREPTAVEIDAMQKSRRESAQSIFDRVKTQSGGAWGNVYYRELGDMAQDGDFARALMAYIGHKRGETRHQQIRELITPLQFHALARKHGRLPQ